MNLRARIIFVALLVVALVNAASFVYFVGWERREAVMRLRDAIQENARLLQIVTAGPLYDGNVAQLGATLDSIFANRDVLEIELKALRGDISIARKRAAETQRGERIEREIAIARGGDALGTIRITYTTGNIEQRLAQSRDAVLRFSLLLMAGMGVLIYLLATRLTRPIGRLTAAAQAIAQGDLKQDIDTGGGGELTILGQSFVRMRDAVRETISDLAEKNRLLHEQMEERARAEEALRLSDERLQQAVRVSDLGIFDHDHRTDTIYWSPQQRRIYGWDAHEAVTLQKYLAHVHAEDVERIAAAVARAHDPAGDGRFDVEHRITHRDGAVRWIATRSRTLFEGEAGARRPVRTVGAVLDVTERRLKEQEMRVKDSAIATSLNAFAIAEVGGGIFYVNPAFLRMWGYAEESEVIGRAPADFTADPAQAQAIVRHLVEHGSFLGEITGKRTDGSTFPAELSASAVKDARGAVTHLMASFVDITERKLAQDALHKSEARISEAYEILNDAIENAPAAIALYDAEDRLIAWNSMFKETFFAFNRSLVQRGTEFRTMLKEFYASGQMRTPQGEAWLEERIRQHRDPSGNGELELTGGRWFQVRETLSRTGRVTSVYTDITALKERERALRESEARISEAYATLNDAIESAPSAIAIYDAADRLIAFNSRFRAFFAFDESLVRPGAEFATLVREFTESGQIARPLRLEDGWLEERQCLHREPRGPIELNLADGRWLLITETRASSGGIVSVYNDISALKEREAQLQRLNEELESKVAERTAELATANKELEAFAYSVSHDLRAPLRGIDGYSQVLIAEHGDKLEPEARQLLERVRVGAQHMGRLITELLGLSRVARTAVRSAEVRLSALAQSVVEELKAEAAGRTLEWRIEPGMKVHGDAGLLRIALVNLLGNALKYTRNTSPARIEVGVSARQGKLVEIYVRDNGAGFDMAHAGRLFQPFQRLHAAHEFEGTGIGLAIVQRVIEKHGGAIRGEGRPGAGATFYFTLPA